MEKNLPARLGWRAGWLWGVMLSRHKRILLLLLLFLQFALLFDIVLGFLLLFLVAFIAAVTHGILLSII
jgi:hypothetical protein